MVTMVAPNPERRGPVPGVVGAMLARAYAAEIARRNRRFDAGRGVTRLDRPVISVGNLSAGGTGKTPMVAHLARALLAEGRRPCIAMRGYRARDGESDEASAYRRSLADVPVVADPDRAMALAVLLGTEQGRGVDAVLLDDGFQHRHLARDLDVVLIDLTRDPFRDRLLPAGWLREPVEELRRAQVVVGTHAESASPGAIEAIDRRVRDLGPGGMLAVCRHEWTALDVFEGGRDREERVAWLGGRRVLAVCAIGNPGPFFARAGKEGGGGITRVALPDHDAYTDKRIAELRERLAMSRAEVVLVTDKDWSRLAARAHEFGVPIARPRLELVFERGWAELRERVLGVVAARARTGKA